MSFPPRFVSLSAALATTVALAACGGGSTEKSGPTPSSGGSSSSSNAQDAAQVKLLQCVREQGVDVPDSALSSGGMAQLSAAERQRAEAALRGPCKKYAAQAFGDTNPQSPEFLDALTKYTVCLRQNGADVQDPDPNDPRASLESLDQSDPTIASAMSACQDKLPTMNGGG